MAEFMVHTKGEVEVVEEARHTFIIQADSLEEAQEIGRNMFASQYGGEVYNLETAISPSNRNVRGWIGIGLLTFSILLSFRNWREGNTTNIRNFTPDLFSMICSFGMYLAFVVKSKGLFQMVNDALDIAYLVVNVTFLAGIIKMLLFRMNFSFLGSEFIFDSQPLFLFAILISWIGYKSLSGSILLLTFVLGILKIVSLSEAMGNWGVVYVIVSGIALLFYVSIEPAIIDSTPHVFKSFAPHKRWIKQDLTSFSRDTTRLGKKVTRKIKGRMNR